MQLDTMKDKLSAMIDEIIVAPNADATFSKCAITGRDITVKTKRGNSTQTCQTQHIARGYKVRMLAKFAWAWAANADAYLAFYRDELDKMTATKTKAKKGVNDGD